MNKLPKNKEVGDCLKNLDPEIVIDVLRNQIKNMKSDKDKTDELFKKRACITYGTLEEIEEQAIIISLKRNNGNRVYAAKELGIGERTLYRKLRSIGK